MSLALSSVYLLSPGSLSLWAAGGGNGLPIEESLQPRLEKPASQPGGPPNYKSLEPQVKGQISVNRNLEIAAGGSTVSLSMRDADLRDILNILAKQGKFNILLDSSVEGTLTVDVQNVSINKALEYIFTVSDLTYYKDGNTLIVAAQKVAEEKNLNTQTFKAIPVLYRSAAAVADQFNQTLFKAARPGGSKEAVASFDPESNSLLIMGTEADIRLVMKALNEVDLPRNRRTYAIHHNTPMYVANALVAHFTPSIGGAGGAAGGAGGAAGAAGGAGGAAGGVQAQGPITLIAGSMTIIADPISSSVTVMGTAEQLAMANEIIRQVDVKRPQVSIEVALVEVGATTNKRFEPNIGQIRLGEWTLDLIPSSTTATNILSYNRAFDPAGLPILNTFSILNSLTERNSKILANPTILALDGTQSQISITEEVATFNTTQDTNAAGATTLNTTVEKQNVGVSLTITPTITNDGSVTLNLRPDVSQVTGIASGGTPPAVTQTPLIATRNVTISGVRVHDGQTLIIGGLLQETNIQDWRKIPGLSDLPILGAMFKASNGLNGNQRGRTELVLMVTPHIIKEPAVTYFENPSVGAPGNYINPNQGHVPPHAVPQSLPDSGAGASGAPGKPTASNYLQPSAPKTSRFGQTGGVAAAAVATHTVSSTSARSRIPLEPHSSTPQESKAASAAENAATLQRKQPSQPFGGFKEVLK
ncbi:MAG: secretin and TonB N-terminal domain-containing protein [Candidatus Melainabacteria bacterium]|nr:secretin and TonB N-terminal domain-containing protein [Candidatus Melainabacteria bacterium]